MLRALVLALVGDSAHAKNLADDLEKRFPDDTIVRFNYSPTLRAQLALGVPGGAAKAVEALAVASPYELGIPGSNTLRTNLYPVYVRGEALLAAHQGPAAAAEFQKILDWPGIVVNEPIGPLAHLGLARASRVGWRHCEIPRRLQRFLHPLERLRSKCPRLAASKIGVRQIPQ